MAPNSNSELIWKEWQYKDWSPHPFENSSTGTSVSDEVYVISRKMFRSGFTYLKKTKSAS